MYVIYSTSDILQLLPCRHPACCRALSIIFALKMVNKSCYQTCLCKIENCVHRKYSLVILPLDLSQICWLDFFRILNSETIVNVFYELLTLIHDDNLKSYPTDQLSEGFQYFCQTKDPLQETEDHRKCSGYPKLSTINCLARLKASLLNWGECTHIGRGSPGYVEWPKIALFTVQHDY